MSITLIDEDGVSADRAEIVIDDRDGRVAFPEMDATLDIALGFRPGALTPMGRFAVDGVSGTGPRQTMTVSATAADMKGAIRAPKTRAWENVTLSAIVATIAAEAGLDPVVGESVRTALWPYLAQTAESDLHFLTRIAATLDATTKPAGGRLIVQRRGEGRTAAGDAMTPVALAASRLSDWRWKLDAREDYGAVEAEWADTAGGTTHKVTKGAGKPVRKLRHVHASAGEAERACAAELARAGRAGLTLTASLAGFEPGLFAGGAVTVTGLRPELDGDWHVARVVHELCNGLTTKFEALKAKA
nr:contractile injection system protein, VgrG/Pvc8 family [Defluviimonas salinarum]